MLRNVMAIDNGKIIGIPSAASGVSYDNTDSGLSSTNVQDALDEVSGELSDKVDKVAGKGLSTNDYTNADKAIVDGVTSALAGKANSSDLGDKSNLTTTDKSSCVAAINELNSAKAKKYTYYTSATGINSIDLTQISFDELEIVVIAPLTSYSCVFDLHVFKTDLSSTYLYYSTGNSTGNKSSMIKVGITQSLCILNTSICENVNVINDTVIKVYYR